MLRGCAYSGEQLDLVRILIEKEEATTPEIHQLTGIPTGSIGYIVKRLGIELLRGVPNFHPRSRMARILFARKIAVLKSRYASQLASLFPDA